MTRDSNLSLVLHGANNLKLEDRPVPQPGPDEVQVRIARVGICGSDVHFWVDGTMFGKDVTAPMVLGHESSGTISAIGSEVTNLKVGDRVAIEPGLGCRKCQLCKSGRYNLCKDKRFCATPPTHGTITRFFVHPADFVYKLPDHVSLEEGALLEPLTVGVTACGRGGVSGGHRVLICGAGPIGLVNLLTAKAYGASRVLLTDISESRLNFAKELGADAVINVSGKKPQALAKEIAELLDGEPDVSIECSGSEAGLQTAIYATKSAGTMVMVGMGPMEVRVPLLDAMVKQVDIRGVFCYANSYPTALELMASGKVNMKPLVTHRYKMEQAVEAFEQAKNGATSEGTVKVMICCSENASEK